MFAARLVADPVLSEGWRLDRGFRRALDRWPRPNERQSLLDFLALQKEHYARPCGRAEKLVDVGLAPAPRAEDPAELAAWTQVSPRHAQSHETITVY